MALASLYAQYKIDGNLNSITSAASSISNSTAQTAGGIGQDQHCIQPGDFRSFHSQQHIFPS